MKVPLHPCSASLAAETLKVLLGLDGTLTGRVLLLDARVMEWRSIKLARDPECPVCGGKITTATSCGETGPETESEKT